MVEEVGEVEVVEELGEVGRGGGVRMWGRSWSCLVYTSDAADEKRGVEVGGGGGGRKKETSEEQGSRLNHCMDMSNQDKSRH